MGLNKRSLNRDVVNDGSYIFAQGSGALISFEDEIKLLQVGSGLLISFSDEIIAVASGNLIAFNDFVYNSSVGTYLTRNGYYPILTIDGRVIPNDEITGQLVVERTENDAAQMTFSLLCSNGLINFSQYEGKTVTLSVIDYEDNINYRVYTGIVNYPDVDIINGILTFQCSDNRTEQINSQLSSLVPYIGWYNTNAFGVANDLADELQKRLTTVPYVVDFNAYGQYKYTALAVKATADFTLTNSDVYRENSNDPRVLLTPRSRLINTVNCEAEYQFQRLYHRQISYSWTATYANSTCDFLINGYSVASKAMVQQAANAAGWPIRGDITYTPILAAGFYNCSGGTIGWQTSSLSGINVDTGALDANGNKVYKFQATSIVDLTQTLCFGASWQATKRWTQNISERYTLKITAPQSVNQFGEITAGDSLGVSSEFDTTQWENYPAYRGAPTGYATTPAQPAASYYFNLDSKLSDWYQCVNLLQNRAKTTILRSHRDNQCIFERRIWPAIDLAHTVYLNCDRLQVQGKVYNIKHTIDVTTGEAKTNITLKFSRASGSTSETGFTVPPRPTFSPAVSGTDISLDSHYGQEPQASWNGHIGNKYITVNTGNGTTDRRKTTYTEEFRVDTPAIEDLVRANKVLTKTVTYDIAIPNDLCEVYKTTP